MTSVTTPVIPLTACSGFIPPTSRTAAAVNKSAIPMLINAVLRPSISIPSPFFHVAEALSSLLTAQVRTPITATKTPNTATLSHNLSLSIMEIKNREPARIAILIAIFCIALVLRFHVIPLITPANFFITLGRYLVNVSTVSATFSKISPTPPKGANNDCNASANLYPVTSAPEAMKAVNILSQSKSSNRFKNGSAIVLTESITFCIPFLIPITIPSMKFSAISMALVDGEWIPKKSLILSSIISPKATIASQAFEPPLLIPFTNPDIISSGKNSNLFSKSSHEDTILSNTVVKAYLISSNVTFSNLPSQSTTHEILLPAVFDKYSNADDTFPIPFCTIGKLYRALTMFTTPLPKDTKAGTTFSIILNKRLCSSIQSLKLAIALPTSPVILKISSST